MLGWRASVSGGDEIEGLGVAGIREEMAEAGVEFRAVLLGPVADFPGNIGKGLQMRGWIAVPPGVIGDDVQAALEQGGEFVFHEVWLAHPEDSGNCGIDAGRFDR
jgi:hypothetical protein